MAWMMEIYIFVTLKNEQTKGMNDVAIKHLHHILGSKVRKFSKYKYKDKFNVSDLHRKQSVQGEY